MSQFHQMTFEIPSHGAYLGGVRFFTHEKAPAVLCLHGMIENGRIFYSRSGKGLAPWLQRQGVDTFVADFRGRGASRPKISEGLQFGQTDLITKDIPDLINFTYNQKQQTPLFVITHSWSGVMLMASLCRHPELLPMIKGVVFFGTKRTIRTWSLARLIELEVFWNRLLLLGSRTVGYLPAKKWRVGADDETYLTQKHSVDWIRSDKWVDPVDCFDYSRAIGQMTLPPLLAFAGKNDAYLGNPSDCKDFVREIGLEGKAEFHTLGQDNGHLLDYDHISLLTAPEGERDHFLVMGEWMGKHGR